MKANTSPNRKESSPTNSKRKDGGILKAPDSGGPISILKTAKGLGITDQRVLKRFKGMIEQLNRVQVAGTVA